jgi:hypothetical protein
MYEILELSKGKASALYLIWTYVGDSCPHLVAVSVKVVSRNRNVASSNPTVALIDEHVGLIPLGQWLPNNIRITITQNKDSTNKHMLVILITI